MLTVEPTRANDLILRALAEIVVSRTDKPDPRRSIPYNEIELPYRTKLRHDIELPKVT
jgi:hypothetical protein